jgi:Cd2+/Zn2+-exporting ATPase
MDQTPAEATVMREGRAVRLSVDDIRVGDVMVVRPGERIAMDGVVTSGESAVNQAPITGESMPAEKFTGDEVYAGSINGSGALDVRVTRLARDNTLARIVHLVEEAQVQKAPAQQVVDRFARYYTPAVIAGAILIAAAPTLLSFVGIATVTPLEGFYRALVLLVISCPCALVISTPVSIVAAIGNAARRGILVKGGASLEVAGSVNVVAFDKTGTLTAGRPVVTDVISLNDQSADNILALAAAIESRTDHPLASAIMHEARHRRVTPLAVEQVEALPGLGAKGIVNGTTYFIGSVRLFADDASATGAPRSSMGAGASERAAIPDSVAARLEQLQRQGKTAMLVGRDGEPVGLIAVADQARAMSAAAVAGLRRVGIRRIVMLTGDNAETARTVANELGVDEFRAQLLPEDKVAAIGELLAEYGRVAMVGDGVNDAPALATATIGIAIAATDTALETADIGLMSDDLTQLPFIIALSRHTVSVIRQNIAASLLTKAAFLALGFLGLATLWMAVAADMGTSLLVTLNGMRLLAVGHQPLAVKQKVLTADD